MHLHNIVGSEHVQCAHLILLVILVVESGFATATLENFYEVLKLTGLIVFERQVEPIMECGALILENFEDIVARRQIIKAYLDDLLKIKRFLIGNTETFNLHPLASSSVE